MVFMLLFFRLSSWFFWLFNSSYIIQDFVFEDLYFNVDYIVSGVCFRGVVVDVSMQSVQWYVIFVVLFGMCDFCVVQMVVNFNFNIFSIQMYCVLYSMFYSMMEYNVMFQLRSDVVSNQFCVQFRFMNFGDVDLCRNVSDVCYDFMQFFYVFIFFIDNDIWVSSVNGYMDVFSWMFDNDMRYGCFSQFFSQVLMYFKIVVQVVSEFFGVCKLGRVLWFYNIQVNIIRMYFLIYCQFLEFQ